MWRRELRGDGEFGGAGGGVEHGGEFVGTWVVMGGFVVVVVMENLIVVSESLSGELIWSVVREAEECILFAHLHRSIERHGDYIYHKRG